MVVWQHKYYAPISILVGVVLPTLIASAWGDFWGGYFYGAMLRMVIVHHATFFVNSLAHSLGEKSVSDLHTSYDSFITAILTLGEGYHNYHHEFPHDYRNGIKFYHYDPTKWLIGGLSYLGLTYNLQEIPEPEIQKAMLQMKQRSVNKEMSVLSFGKNFDHLPEISMEEFNQRVANGETLVHMEGIVLDIKNFVHDHPGTCPRRLACFSISAIKSTRQPTITYVATNPITILSTIFTDDAVYVFVRTQVAAKLC